MTVYGRRVAATATPLRFIARPSCAAKQVVALFPPGTAETGADNVLRSALPILDQTLNPRLEDRFYIRPAIREIHRSTEEMKKAIEELQKRIEQEKK